MWDPLKENSIYFVYLNLYCRHIISDNLNIKLKRFVPSFLKTPTTMASTLSYLLRRAHHHHDHHRLHLSLRSLTTKIDHPSKYGPPRPHEHTKPSTFLSTWKDPPPTSDPRDALRRLEDLRKDYSRKVSACRKEYMYEMEMQRQEKIMKEQAKRDASRVAREESKAAKKETDVARLEKHNAFREELKLTLVSVSKFELKLYF